MPMKGHFYNMSSVGILDTPFFFNHYYILVTCLFFLREKGIPLCSCLDINQLSINFIAICI